VTAMGFGIVRADNQACTNCQENKSRFDKCHQYRSLSSSCSGCLWRHDPRRCSFRTTFLFSIPLRSSTNSSRS
jgi:hypothetical protein